MVYKFTPALVKPQELKATIVARQPLIDNLIKKIKSSSKSGSFKHHILVGPRGIGKTHILLLIYYAIQEDKYLKKYWIPVKFSEEEYSINRISDFFLRILEELLNEEYSESLDALLKKLKTSSEQEIVDSSIDFLMNLKKKKGSILLFIENLNLVFQQIGDEAELGRLREILMKYDFLMIVGTSPTIFKEIIDYKRSFYNFFEIENLPELTEDETVLLFRKRVEYDKKKEILKDFKRYEPRIRAIHPLTGGSPRLILTFYEIITEGDIVEIEKEFEKLLDQLTPYYQAKIEAIPPQQRKIFDTLALMDEASTPTEIAKKARIKQQTVISQLKRLEDMGYVRPVKQKRRKRVFYDVSERLFRIWREMRILKEGGRVGFLVKLLKIWYTPKELDGEFIKLKSVYDEVYKEGSIDKVKSIITRLAYFQEAIPLEKGLEVHQERIEKLLKSGDFRGAEKEIKEFRLKAEDIKSTRLSILAYLYEIGLGLARWDFNKALEAINRVLIFEPELKKLGFKNIQTFLKLKEMILYLLNNHKDILQILKTEMTPKDALESLNGVIELASKGELPFFRAITLFDLSEEIDRKEQTLGIELLLSFVNTLSKKHKKAETYLRKALSIKVDEEKLQRWLVFFMNVLISKGQIDFSKKSLEIILTTKGEYYEKLLKPYAIALKYLETKDIEILDRLHPEMREIVEKIIERTNKSTEN